MQTIIPVLILLLISTHVGVDFMLHQWWVLIAICSIILCKGLKKHYGVLIATAVGYTLLQSAAFFIFHYYQDVPAQIHDVLLVTNLYGIVTILVPCITVAYLNEKKIKDLIYAVPIFILMDCLYVFYGAYTGTTKYAQGVGYSGFLDYAGMNGTLIAMSLPLCLSSNYNRGIRFLFLFASIGAIVLSKSSIPYGVAAVGLFGFFIHRTRENKGAFIGLTLATIPLLVGAIIEGKLFIDSGSRFQAYKIFYTEWVKRGDIMTGLGVGVFQVIAAQWQELNHFMLKDGEGFVWLWAHSDWLQCLIELGVIGFVLYLLAYCNTLKLAWKKKGTMSSECFGLLLGCGFSAIFNYPCRYAVTAFLILLSVRCAFVSESSETQVGVGSSSHSLPTHHKGGAPLQYEHPKETVPGLNSGFSGLSFVERGKPE